MANVLASRQYCMSVLGDASSVECVHYCQQYFLLKCSNSQISVPLLTCNIACFFPPFANPCPPAKRSDLHSSDYFLISGKCVSLLNRHKKHQCCITLSFSPFTAFLQISSTPSKHALYRESKHALCVYARILLSLTS